MVLSNHLVGFTTGSGPEGKCTLVPFKIVRLCRLVQQRAHTYFSPVSPLVNLVLVIRVHTQISMGVAAFRDGGQV